MLHLIRIDSKIIMEKKNHKYVSISFKLKKTKNSYILSVEFMFFEKSSVEIAFFIKRPLRNNFIFIWYIKIMKNKREIKNEKINEIFNENVAMSGSVMVGHLSQQYTGYPDNTPRVTPENRGHGWVKKTRLKYHWHDTQCVIVIPIYNIEGIVYSYIMSMLLVKVFYLFIFYKKFYLWTIHTNAYILHKLI